MLFFYYILLIKDGSRRHFIVKLLFREEHTKICGNMLLLSSIRNWKFNMRYDGSEINYCLLVYCGWQTESVWTYSCLFAVLNISLIWLVVNWCVYFAFSSLLIVIFSFVWTVKLFLSLLMKLRVVAFQFHSNNVNIPFVSTSMAKDV